MSPAGHRRQDGDGDTHTCPGAIPAAERAVFGDLVQRWRHAAQMLEAAAAGAVAHFRVEASQVLHIRTCKARPLVCKHCVAQTA